MSDKGSEKLTAGFVVEKQAIASTTKKALEPAQAFDKTAFREQELQQEPDNEELNKHGYSSMFGILLPMLVVLVATIELILFGLSVYSEPSLLDSLWLIIFALLFVLSGRALFKAYQGLRLLKQRESRRQQASLLFSNDGVGTAEGFCQQLLLQLPEQYQQRWQQLTPCERTNKEIIQLFERQIVSMADIKALQYISKHTSAAGVMIAVSPLAMMDMLVILWRSLSMFQQIADCYGMQLGYWARIKLLKDTFKLMVFAGASEVLIDTGSVAFGASLGAKLSAQLAQGIGAGVLISRLGLRAMQECRPVPWLSLDKPKVSDITRELISQVRNLKNT